MLQAATEEVRGELTTFEVASPTASDTQPNGLAMRTGSLHGSMIGYTNRMFSTEFGTGRSAPPLSLIHI